MALSSSLSGEDIVCLYCEAWESPLRTSKHVLMEHFAQRNRVLYVETPVHPMVALRRPADFVTRYRRAWAGPRKICPNLYTMCGTYPLPYHAESRWTSSLRVNRINQHWFGEQLRNVLDRLEFRKPLVWLYSPLIEPILESLKPRAVILHAIDDWSGLRAMPDTFATLDRQVAERADLVVAVSSVLFDRYKRLNANTHLVRHGFHEYFSPDARSGSIPTELAGLPRPILGYYGALHKIDPELVSQIAAARPDWSIVLIGPTDGPQGANMEWTRSHKNIYLLGSKPQRTIPAYVRAFSAALFPFTVDELTWAMCPIKAYECLAMGVPVVSTRIPEMERFGELVYTARSEAEFLAGVERALQENADVKARRMNAVRDCTWTHRLAQIDRLAQSIMTQASQPLDRVC